jgi:CPA2 family monovalent cation:H+ antiporter-2
VAIIVGGKALIAFAIVAVIGYGARTALFVAAALAQIGEFSFILVAVGMTLDLLPADATSLILAGAILSITLNPVIFGSLERLEGLLLSWQDFARWAGRRHPEEEAEITMRRHVIICGYGRSGSNLARILRGRNLPFVIIENDPFVVERVRAAGMTCVFGDATQPVVLDQAQAEDAQTVAVTFAEQPDASITVQNARRLNPRLNVVARANGPQESRLLRQSGAAEVVDADLEASLEFVRHVLHRYGIDAREIGALQMRWRAEQQGGLG